METVIRENGARYRKLMVQNDAVLKIDYVDKEVFYRKKPEFQHTWILKSTNITSKDFEMAQSAGFGRSTYGFLYLATYSIHDLKVGRITSMATTTHGTLVMCDHDRKQLVFMYKDGSIERIDVSDPPYDVGIGVSNNGYVTMPSSGKMFYVDPEMRIIQGVQENTDVLCVRETSDNRLIALVLPKQEDCKGTYFVRGFTSLEKVQKQFGVTVHDLGISKNNNRLLKFETQNADFWAKCYAIQSGRNKLDIHVTTRGFGGQDKSTTINIPGIDVISDVTVDEKGHVYLSGLYSNDIHRLTGEGRPIDIPLTKQNRITKPTAICFSKDYKRFYVACGNGTELTIFNVV